MDTLDKGLAFLRVQEDPERFLKEVNQKIETLETIRARLNKQLSNGKRKPRSCTLPECGSRVMTRKRDGEPGYGYCREHWNALSQKEKKATEKAFRQRMKKAREARSYQN